MTADAGRRILVPTVLLIKIRTKKTKSTSSYWYETLLFYSVFSFNSPTSYIPNARPLLVHTTSRVIDPFRTAVPLGGQTSQIPSSLSPKRGCGSKRFEVYGLLPRYLNPSQPLVFPIQPTPVVNYMTLLPTHTSMRTIQYLSTNPTFPTFNIPHYFTRCT